MRATPEFRSAAAAVTGKLKTAALILAMPAVIAATALVLANGVVPGTQQITADQQNTVVIDSDTNPEALSDQGMSFSKAMATIINPSNPSGVSQSARIAFVQSMLESFTLTSITNPGSGVTTNLIAQPGLQALQASNLLDQSAVGGLQLEAAVNRLDKAAADGSTCGEMRLIYSRFVDPVNRLFVILETTVPNPSPSLGVNGCQPFAQLWNGFSKEGPNEIATGLRQLFFAGLPTASGTLPGLLNANNLGRNGEGGAVRMNAFVNDNNGVPIQNPPFIWELYQWSVQSGGSPGSS